MVESKLSVVLLSGGIDSSTTFAIAVEDGFDCYALSFDYGQRHKVELRAAKAVAEKLGAKEHLVIKFDMGLIGGSALTGDSEVPKGRAASEIGSQIPETYVPARNTIFLSFALAWAEKLGASSIFMGANCIDYGGYPDCRPEYIEAFQKMVPLATKRGVQGEIVRIRTPLIELSKSEIVRLGTDLGMDYSLTFSCYDPVEGDLACGQCDSCIIRRNGFLEAGLNDPTRYAKLK